MKGSTIHHVCQYNVKHTIFSSGVHINHQTLPFIYRLLVRQLTGCWNWGGIYNFLCWQLPLVMFQPVDCTETQCPSCCSSIMYKCLSWAGKPARIHPSQSQCQLLWARVKQMLFNDTQLLWDLEMLFFRLSVRSESQILSFHYPRDQVVYENLVLAGIPNPKISRLQQSWL